MSVGMSSVGDDNSRSVNRIYILMDGVLAGWISDIETVLADGYAFPMSYIFLNYGCYISGVGGVYLWFIEVILEFYMPSI